LLSKNVSGNSKSLINSSFFFVKIELALIISKMKNLIYGITLVLFSACNSAPKTDHLEEVSVLTPTEKIWNLTLIDNEISYTMMASTMENKDMQFSININEGEKKHAIMVSHFPNIHRYALASMNNSKQKELILIGTNELSPENELIIIFYLDTTENLYQLKSIALPEENHKDPRKRLNSVNNYSIKPPYIIRNSDYQPLEGDLEKETLIYKITNNNKAELVSKIIQ